MKNRSRSRSGFTLVELLVALGITAIIVAMLVTISATALTGYSESRSQVKAAREAKAALDQIARDLESLVVRSGGDYDWLWVSSDDPPGSSNNQSPNAARAVFFTAATDRYDGAINTSADQGGDVSTVGYRLLFRDPVSDVDDNAFSTFILYRQLINPDETFENLLASQDLESAYSSYITSESDSRNFLCENIYEFSLSFTVEFTENELPTRQKILVVDSTPYQKDTDLSTACSLHAFQTLTALTSLLLRSPQCSTH
jgi:prepilin-type N-terminal cleavage/methylation domain-containing protein